MVRSKQLETLWGNSTETQELQQRNLRTPTHSPSRHLISFRWQLVLASQGVLEKPGYDPSRSRSHAWQSQNTPATRHPLGAPAPAMQSTIPSKCLSIHWAHDHNIHLWNTTCTIVYWIALHGLIVAGKYPMFLITKLNNGNSAHSKSSARMNEEQTSVQPMCSGAFVNTRSNLQFGLPHLVVLSWGKHWGQAWRQASQPSVLELLWCVRFCPHLHLRRIFVAVFHFAVCKRSILGDLDTVITIMSFMGSCLVWSRSCQKASECRIHDDRNSVLVQSAGVLWGLYSFKHYLQKLIWLQAAAFQHKLFELNSLEVPNCWALLVTPDSITYWTVYKKYRHTLGITWCSINPDRRREMHKSQVSFWLQVPNKKIQQTPPKSSCASGSIKSMQTTHLTHLLVNVESTLLKTMSAHLVSMRLYHPPCLGLGNGIRPQHLHHCWHELNVLNCVWAKRNLRHDPGALSQFTSCQMSSVLGPCHGHKTAATTQNHTQHRAKSPYSISSWARTSFWMKHKETCKKLIPLMGSYL